MKKVIKLHKLSSVAKKIRYKVIAIILLILIFFVYGFSLQIIRYQTDSDKIENRIKIIFISDLHNSFYGGRDQSALKKNIDNESPDIVIFGGDMVDEHSGTEYAMEIMKYASNKYPCYYSIGNHEEWRNDTDELKNKIAGLGISILEGDFSEISINQQNIRIFGVSEPYSYNQKKQCTQIESCIENIDESAYNILLLHQPQQINECLDYNFDLVLSGHAHGGQWRLPFILENGLWAPDQGLFPELTNGKYEYGNTIHIISKGLARPLRMIMIPRIYNRPEFTVIEVF